MTDFKTQIAIVGGGITGLWLLNRLRQAGFNTCLFEKGGLGCGQTFASQGMIHGGLKYALGGFTTAASETIADMPKIWRDCLAGTGQVDLTGLGTLSDDYYLFTDAALSSKVTAFFASKSLEARITALHSTEYPEVFNNPAFKGKLYRLQDLVIDTPELMRHLLAAHQQHAYQANVKAIVENGQVTALDLGGGNRLFADRFIFAAGEGNHALMGNAAEAPIQMQLRPLQQVMLKGPLPELFAHAVSLRSAAKPRLTITTHPYSDTENVWYLGGNLAEQGVGLSSDELISRGKSELTKLLPWVDLGQCDWATYTINRAEPAASNKARPDSPFVKSLGNSIVCWPIKLTLTPMLADQVIGELALTPADPQNLNIPLPSVNIAETPWQLNFGRTGND